MVITHYGYLVLKMPSPNGIIKIHRDCTTGSFTLEKLHALETPQEATAGFGELGQVPSSLHQCISSSAPHVQPSDSEDITVKVIQIGADATQTTRIVGNLGDK
jgi:hypothetical protein